MAKKKSGAKPKPSESISITYELLELPTAQHKAGLAGLLLLIESLRGQAAVPEIEEQTATSARIRFTRDSLQTLFDDLYDADVVEVAVASKWQGQSPKREESFEEIDPQTKKAKKARRFVYDVIQPKGRFLQDHLRDEDGVWIKLWRDMLWAIPRGKPTTRIPFNQRAAGEPCGEAEATWKELVAFEKARKANILRSCDVPGAILLGAQAVNAEGVAFQGRSDQTLLLHFWQQCVLLYVPQQFDLDGKGEFVGYVLAIPEVSNLKTFCRLFPRLLRQLPPKARGYRPDDAVIDLPAQGALKFLDHLANLVDARVSDGQVQHAVSAVEYFYMVKVGNNIKTVAGGQVPPRPELLDAYRGLIRSYRNPLFLTALISALLNHVNWHSYLPTMFAERPWRFFIKCDETPRAMPWFSADALARFRTLYPKTTSPPEDLFMSDAEEGPSSAQSLEAIVYRIVQTYVRRKTEEKTGIEYKDFKDKKVTDEKTGKQRMAIPSVYADAKTKLCSDTFLAFRSRRDTDFVDYFTSTIGSVGQYLPPADYQLLASALLRTEGPNSRDDIKTLAMLALSAAS